MKRNKHIQLTYRLTFASAFHFGTGMRNGIIHRVLSRDAEGFLYVPGSTIKGTLRERCEQLAALFDLPVNRPHTEQGGWQEAYQGADIVTRLFGSRFQPSRLYLDDAHLVAEDRALFEPDYGDRRFRQRIRDEFLLWQSEKRTQVKLSRVTRTAQPNFLFTTEYGIQGLRFEGHIRGMIRGFRDDPDQGVDYALKLLLAGLLTLDRLGGSKSGGAGMVQVDIATLHVDGEIQEPVTYIENLGELELYELAREIAREEADS